MASELENYLDCRDVAADPLEFWRNHRQSFPRLFEVAKQTLFAPGSTGDIERIFSVAGYILSERRSRISDENFENQLFANVKIDLPLSDVRKKLKLNYKRAIKSESGRILMSESENRRRYLLVIGRFRDQEKLRAAHHWWIQDKREKEPI